MTASDPRIRPATDDDWPRIWPLFSTIVATGETFAFPDDLTVETGRGWWMSEPPSLTVVLEDDGQILGSVKKGPTGPGAVTTSAPPRSWSTRRPQAVASAAALASYVVEGHREHGFGGIQFNAVVETNAAAVHLWQSLPRRPAGTQARPVCR